MNRGFSIINILIIIGIIALFYLGYNNFAKKDISQANNQQIKSQGQQNKSEVDNSDYPEKEKEKSSTQTVTEKETTAEPEKINQTEEPEPKQPAQPTEPQQKNGFYQNNTYSYSISYPPDWPLRIRSEENISVGTVPPKNGQGAITIEITQKGTNNEINKAKAEAKKYPGIISIEEESITLSGVSGIKLSLINLIINSKDIYILLEKYGFNYIIKYSEESPDFVSQAIDAVKTFKFTK